MNVVITEVVLQDHLARKVYKTEITCRAQGKDIAFIAHVSQGTRADYPIGLSAAYQER